MKIKHSIDDMKNTKSMTINFSFAIRNHAQYYKHGMEVV